MSRALLATQRKCAKFISPLEHKCWSECLRYSRILRQISVKGTDVIPSYLLTVNEFHLVGSLYYSRDIKLPCWIRDGWPKQKTQFHLGNFTYDEIRTKINFHSLVSKHAELTMRASNNELVCAGKTIYAPFSCNKLNH